MSQEMTRTIDPASKAAAHPPRNAVALQQLQQLQQLHFGLACGVTDTGPVRRRNEDKLLIDASLGLVAVADGMGGHAGGDIASAGALLALQEFLRAQDIATLHSAAPGPDWACCMMRSCMPIPSCIRKTRCAITTTAMAWDAR